MFISFREVRFIYENAVEPVLESIRLTVGPGWTGIVGANGSGKTTLLRLAVGELAPTSGKVLLPGAGLYCPQRTDSPPPGFGTLLEAADSAAHRLKAQLGIEADWGERWATLSHGERKRAQIGVVLHGAPAVLAVDEPTNHLDRDTRELVWRALQSFRGIGLLVSHDRDLLDDLCSQCLFLDSSRVTLRPGTYSAGAREVRRERVELRRESARARDAVARLGAELGERRRHYAKAERQRSRRGIPPRDHDARAKVNAARVSDSGSGQRIRQIEGRLRQARERSASLVVERQFALGVAFGGTRSERSLLVSVPEGEIALGPCRTLWMPALVIHAADRVGIEGPNGSGKSTLVRHLVAGLRQAEERVAYIPQEIDAARSQEILEEFLALPRERLGMAMTVVRRLGSDPARLLQSREPSPGEVRKLLLASCIESEPHILVLDEPTNHLDLPSIECLEAALAACRMALLMVSHDRRFLGRLAARFWHIGRGSGGRFELVER